MPLRRSAVLGVLALAAVVADGPGAARAQEAQGKLTEAASQLQKGAVEAAIQLYTEAMADRSLPNDRRAVVMNDRGVAYMRRQNWRAAIEDFNRAAQLSPEYAPLYNNRGNVLLAIGAPREAIKDFDRAIVLSPAFAAAFANRGGAHLKLSQLTRAVADYSKAIELVPNSPAAFNGRGMVHLAAARPYAAIRDFTQAAALDSRFATAYRNRAEALAAIERREEVVEDLSRALAFDARNVETLVMRANAHLAMGNATSALKDFETAIGLGGATAAVLTGRGLAHARADAFEQALNDLGRAIELDPRHARAYAVRAWVYKRMQQPELGLRDVERALKLEPVTADAYWAQGELAESQGRLDTALGSYTKAVGQNPRHRETIEALARIGLVAAREESEVAGAGVERWRVIQSGERFHAVNPAFEGLKVPLEMIGTGTPRLLDWDRRRPPVGQIGLLKFASGDVESASGPVETETVAVIDVQALAVLAMTPERIGQKRANWSWEAGRVVVTAADGATDEIAVRGSVAAAEPALPLPIPGAQQRRVASGDGFQKSTGTPPPWAPWAQTAPAQPQYRESRNAQRPKKQKSLFEMLFGN